MSYYTTKKNVLILVLMEYALREEFITNKSSNRLCLNPCFNGICSASSDVLTRMNLTMQS